MKWYYKRKCFITCVISWKQFIQDHIEFRSRSSTRCLVNTHTCVLYILVFLNWRLFIEMMLIRFIYFHSMGEDFVNLLSMYLSTFGSFGSVFFEYMWLNHAKILSNNHHFHMIQLMSVEHKLNNITSYTVISIQEKICL